MSDNACLYHHGNNCGEPNLDIQYLMGMSPNVPTTYYYVNPTMNWFDWIASVANMLNPPLVFSISYSTSEKFITQTEAQTFNTEAMKLSAMGVTIMGASGDDGVAGSNARYNGRKCCYVHQFPASSPFVTAVGGTAVSSFPYKYSLCAKKSFA